MESNGNGSRSNGVGGTSNADPQAAARRHNGGGDDGGAGRRRGEFVTYGPFEFGDAVSTLERVDERHRRGEGNGIPIMLSLAVSRQRRLERILTGRETLLELQRAFAAVNDDIDVDDARFFPRFVALLGQQREGGRAVGKIELRLNCQGMPDDDMQRLFRDVLPAHRTLEMLLLSLDCVPTRFLRMLTRAIPAADDATRETPLWLVTFEAMRYSEQANAIADMLKRNVAVERLEVTALAELAAEQFNPIVQALSFNTNLRELEVGADVLKHGMLDGVAKSFLRRLDIVGGPSPASGALSSLFRELRTNETMETLRLVCRTGDQDRQALLDLLKTYNYKIRVYDPMGHLESLAFYEYQRRNARIQDAFAQLQHPDPALRRKVCKCLLPNMLGLMSDLPTSLYRIMKLGYVDKVGRLLAGMDVDDDDEEGHRIVALSTSSGSFM